MKKILHIITQMEAGGAQRAAVDLSEYLIDCGYDSSVVFIYKKRASFISNRNIHVIRDGKLRMSNLLATLVNLVEFIQKGKFDVIITHTHYSNIIGLFIAKMCKINNRIAVQHSFPDLYPRVVRFVDLLWGMTGIYKKIVVVSDSLNLRYKNWPKRYRNRLITIHNGVKFEIAPEIDSNVSKLTSVGRLSKEKNHRFIIKVLKNIPNTILYIIGDGELKQELEEYSVELGIEERVIFKGEIDQKLVHELIEKSIFLFPSISESAGLAMIEAMGMGLPIIASRIPAVVEYLGDSGIIVPLEHDIWIEEITKLKDNPQRMQKMGKMANFRALRYSVSKMGENYEKLF